ncbi:hypothetical protein EHI8A_156030 [Entamoeba histolytica HM-1:IMSS-B]|uniref:Uncharacterized protein n=6 Tax=Entamoeba histolytica TaxID=5759 RepID=C4LTV6_ENTH1|nr:hypothetical protein EHI_050860 [Entamoeba histolytica HM-1:IMSS]EMD45684.1 Hypothetical protein EHI5A_152820 [Entamoeba histolytica KU27]EMH74374.1 hypothetical protein EHI8A_156030 [Entamoeba histolytica HM-1:IMSS-B]EMS16021.1 hypothetical protein KM1_231050 [Entamoeba histolytica HM-3:IMSS]ENY61037.1 hypothetical protein EHI7A_140460 [Entamoeba histolytica HM-1:IMSS-A]GAT92015.1 hypothetical protein CL6EHI_050860 [Entamoeba histolytica]|eukprot:XP_656626.1 hypothetical protein EHI_050860 [Entamoeba histolytica HM-1:IMSS]
MESMNIQEARVIHCCCHCPICMKGTFFQTKNPKMKTTRLVLLILKSLKVLNPEIEYYSLVKDILPFINNHLQLFQNLKIFKNGKWRKSILDALNHSALVESGREVCKNRGFYKLKENEEENKMIIEKNKIKDEMSNSLELLENELKRSLKLLEEIKMIQVNEIEKNETSFVCESKRTSIDIIHNLQLSLYHLN